MKENLKAIYQEHQNVMRNFEQYLPIVEEIGQKMLQAINNKGKIFWMGNGGSAADAQHMAAELIGRFKNERRALPSIALTTDTSILTSVGNDYGYSAIFSRQLEGLCQPQDVIIGLSTSGNSENVILGIELGKKIGAYTVALTGETGGKLKSIADVCLTVPSTTTARIQEAHALIGHMLCEVIDNAIG